ncbi:MAG: deoxynucleoside kinase [Rikenellaceae bacterium]|jgi:deoxyadenosine/deoxycytidine kinase|nr:deoxynucleoside kinase [Rikenellaceae bacterium]
MYIAIAGNIGSGKTSLTEILTQEFGFVANYEDDNNPYIGDFYEDMNRWSFNLQVYFLGRRLHQMLAMLRSNANIVQDRTVYEDAHIFARNLHESGLMTTRDFQTYMQIFDLSSGLIQQPDLLIYLRASVPTLISQIQRRGRSYEMSISEEYLRRLNERYNDWIEHHYPGEVLVIDVDRDDFILSPASRERIVAEVRQRIEAHQSRSLPKTETTAHAIANE